MTTMSKIAATLTIAAAVALSGPAAADLDERTIQVVGTWGGLSQWQKYEKPFWHEALPAASGGKLTANAKPMDELGLSGFELMRQLKLGVFDVVHTLVAYSASDVPMAGGIDLAGLVQDRDAYRKMVDAYRGPLGEAFETAYGARILALYSFSSYSLLCNLPAGDGMAKGVEALKGHKIRSHSISMGDFIDGVGGTAVTIPFGEVVPAIQQGVVDCGVTGVLSAYEAKWWQVTNSYFEVPLGFGTVVVAANLDFWKSLSPETQALVEAQVALLESDVMAASAKEDALGISCYGAGPCEIGDPGNNSVMELSETDHAKIREVVSNVVLKRFAERCGEQCTATWNGSVGAALGVEASD